MKEPDRIISAPPSEQNFPHRSMNDSDLPSLEAKIEEIMSLMRTEGPAQDQAKLYALQKLENEPIFKPFQVAAGGQSTPTPEMVLTTAKAWLEGEKAQRRFIRDLPKNPQQLSDKKFITRLAEVLLIPWVLAILVCAATALISVNQEIAAHKAEKIFDADYERTIGIVKELTDLIIASGDLKANLIGEERNGPLDAFRTDKFLKEADSLADSLTRSTDLLLYNEPSAREAQAAAFLEVEKLRYSLASQSSPNREEARSEAEKTLQQEPDRFQPPLTEAIKQKLRAGFNIQYPCGEGFNISRLETL